MTNAFHHGGHSRGAKAAQASGVRASSVIDGLTAGEIDCRFRRSYTQRGNRPTLKQNFYSNLNFKKQANEMNVTRRLTYRLEIRRAPVCIPFTLRMLSFVLMT